LAVEQAWGRVERRSGNRRIHQVRGSNSMRSQQSHDLVRRESRISESGQDLIGCIERLRNEEVRRRGPTAPANWMKSPGVRPDVAMKGFWASTMSSIPAFAWKAVSMSSKMTIDPSATPPPYKARIGTYNNGSTKESTRIPPLNEKP